MKCKTAICVQRNSFRLIWVVFFLFVSSYLSLHAQNLQARADSLQRAKVRMERELELLKTARDSTRSKKDASLAELKLLNRQVYLREQLVQNIKAEVITLDMQIERSERTILSLEEDMVKLKEEFAKLMVAQYRLIPRKSKSFTMMSSKSVSEGYQKLRYIEAIQKSHESQLKMLVKTKDFLALKRIELEEKKVDREKVMIREKIESEKLVVLKEEQKKLYKKLREDEIRLSKEVQNTVANINKINSDIAEVLAAIEEERKKKLAAEGSAKEKEYRDIIVKLNNEFSSNQGKFPWPLPMPNGTITMKFGKQTMDGSDLVIDSKGLDFTTLPNQPVRAIFKGKVEAVMPVPGQGKMIIISHGEYYSIYANLDNVIVKAGEEVEMLDSIGTAKTDNSTNETKIHFQIYRERTALDPEHWLLKKS